jgi:SAM-dependent methyltransferase
MLFGYRDEFEYFECKKCGCLQIKDIPDNLSKYYPEDYYSYQKPDYCKDNFLKSFLKHQRARYWLYGKNIVGILLSIGRSVPHYFDWLKKVKVNFDSEILDVGCGAGHHLLCLNKNGFSNLTGVDPFVKNSIHYECGVTILKKEITKIKHQYDLIMLHQSFEHMPEPLSMLREIYRLLKPDRFVLIGIPVASSFAWSKYGTNWVNLDAPRHLFLHSIKSIKILSNNVGFQVVDVVFNSTAFQFWGSELYLRDIPLLNYVDVTYDKSFGISLKPKEPIFSKQRIESFKIKADELNKNEDGDSAYFYLYKPSNTE